MDFLKIINKYYEKNTKARNILLSHSRAVAKKALEIGGKNKNLNPDLKFIEEASMLHDIGIFLTNAPSIYCFGKRPYICHGFLGREILEKEGFLSHALVCERHVGAGISKEETKRGGFPLPFKDMIPLTIEEKIVCVADKFFSKKKDFLEKEKTIEEIKKDIKKYGKESFERFENWLNILGITN